MGILDEAIKEHLELKRQHGAGESELKQLEDEAFGAAERPGAGEPVPEEFTEGPTQFMAVPEVEEDGPRGEVEPEGAEAFEQQPSPRSRPDVADLQEAPPPTEEPVEEEAPAMEHEAIPELREEPGAESPRQADGEREAEPGPDQAAGPSTEERRAIADQPTELYDVEGELDDPASAAPAKEEADGEEEEEDFFDDTRLSEELNQALEAPEDEESAEEQAEGSEEHPRHGGDAAGAEEDVLEETPDFLEQQPEDDQLWFEQKPPKDFDFDD